MKTKKHQCRACGEELTDTFLDLGMSPLSNSYIPLEDAEKGQMTYPLYARVCRKCFLVQLDEFESPSDIFSDYAYFSSYSASWLEHAKTYTDYMLERFGFDETSSVVEIASNDGYLLQYFQRKNIPVLGIEPAQNVAKVAREEKGIPTICQFFGEKLARKLRAEGKQADLLIANNVLAHVPDINDFVEGLRLFLADDGVLTLEFPHLLKLMQFSQFDTIYHEHFSYLSFHTVKRIFETHGLELFDVEEQPTHGGSLRIFACHNGGGYLPYKTSSHVAAMLDKEAAAGLTDLKTYLGFAEKVSRIKNELLKFLIAVKEQKKHVAAYGAAAKGNTLLNYCGIRQDYIDYVVDKNPHKQNTLLPGSRIPVYAPERLEETKPEYILLLPWNLKTELLEQLAYTKKWSAKLILPIPELTILA